MLPEATAAEFPTGYYWVFQTPTQRNSLNPRRAGQGSKVGVHLRDRTYYVIKDLDITSCASNHLTLHVFRPAAGVRESVLMTQYVEVPYIQPADQTWTNKRLKQDCRGQCI